MRVETVPFDDRAALITVFAQNANHVDVPFVSFLKDGIGDPMGGRVRQVWVLSYVRPTVLQRMAAALPFLYWRPGTHSRVADSTPRAVLDAGAPAAAVWSSLAGALVQSQILDVRGVRWRAPSRGYRGNAADYRNMEVASALELLARVDTNTAGSAALSSEDWQHLQARIMLSRKLFGGLIGDSHLTLAYERQYARVQERRAHNWSF